MVLLASALRPLNPREIKLQGLEGWHMLVHALSQHAPLQLGGVVNQVRPEAGQWWGAAGRGEAGHGTRAATRVPGSVGQARLVAIAHCDWVTWLEWRPGKGQPGCAC
jgi:hypothetical protein